MTTFSGSHVDLALFLLRRCMGWFASSPISALLVATILASCASPQSGRDAQATQIAAQIYGTQTAQAATGTPTPTPSVTPTPTLKPTRTIVPTFTLTPPPNASYAIIDLSELPPSFVSLPSEVLSEFEALVPFDGNVITVDGYVNPEQGQLILEWAIYIRSGRFEFDQQARAAPDYLINVLSLEAGNEKLDEPTQIVLDGIGDMAVGRTAAVTIRGISVRWDIAVFRRGKVGIILITQYYDGDTPAITIHQLSRIIDERIQQGPMPDAPQG